VVGVEGLGCNFKRARVAFTFPDKLAFGQGCGQSLFTARQPQLGGIVVGDGNPVSSTATTASSSRYWP
jgi:hypothetical protein